MRRTDQPQQVSSLTPPIKTQHVLPVSHPRALAPSSGGQPRRTTTSTHSRSQPVIKRGLLTSFDPLTYTASVLLLEATSTFLNDIPVAYHIDGTSALVNNLCAVLFFDLQNYTDAVILAIFPNVNLGAPPHPPGRMTLIPAYALTTNETIAAGGSSTYSITAVGSIVPIGALALLLSLTFTSSSVGAGLHIGTPGSSTITALGTIYSSGGTINGSTLAPLSSAGQLTISASGGSCNVTASIYGYVF